MKITTNREKLLRLNVQGQVSHPRLLGDKMYITTWDGKSRLSIGYGGINYTLRIGDSVFGWAESDHAEPGVSIVNTDSNSNLALTSYSCIGNQSEILTGGAKGKKGTVTGKSGYITFPDNVLVHFDEGTIESLAIGDKVQISSIGQGLKIDTFNEVKIYGVDPSLLEMMNIVVENGKLVVPVTFESPPYLMGQGVGERPAEFGYYCIQTNGNEDEPGVKRLRIGDVVALRDQYCGYGRGYYKGAMTIGIVIHGASDIAGHGPGVNPIMTTRGGEVSPVIDDGANIARYLGIERKR
jgi:hypothetical protein